MVVSCNCLIHVVSQESETVLQTSHLLVQGFVAGAGVSGVATSLLSFFSQLEATGDQEGARSAADVAPAACTYFAAAAAITGLCVLCYSALSKLEYSRVRLAPYLASE